MNLFEPKNGLTYYVTYIVYADEFILPEIQNEQF